MEKNIDVAIEKASGRLHWVVAEACQQSSVLSEQTGGKITMDALDDDVAEVVTTFLHYNCLHPIQVQSPIMRVPPSTLPAWAAALITKLLKDKRFARDVLIQTEPFNLPTLQCLAASCI
jgi:hypothetical protein